MDAFGDDDPEDAWDADDDVRTQLRQVLGRLEDQLRVHDELRLRRLTEDVLTVLAKLRG